jgi:hypothetical protein
MGVLQKDLAEAIKNGNDCKVQVLKALKDKLLPDAVLEAYAPQAFLPS